MRRLLPCFALLLGAPALGHEFWLLPSKFHAEPGERIDVGLRVGMNFQGEPVARRPDRIVRFDAQVADMMMPIGGEAGADPAGGLVSGVAGLHVIAYQSGRSRITLEGAQFAEYLREEGLTEILEARAAEGIADRTARELHSRCAKSLVLVGQDASAADRSVGLPLELVVATPLRAIGVGGSVEALLLREGRPLAGVLVQARREGSPGSTVSARTGEDGRARLDIDRPGVWMLAAVHMVRAELPPDDPDAAFEPDYESLWATVTFDVPPPGAAAMATDAGPIAYPGLDLVWQDEFNIDGPPDPASWVHEIGFIRNREAQWYQRPNAWCADGLLVIEARRERAENTGHDAAAPAEDWKRSRTHAEYTSASIKTRGLHEWTFGRFEMRGRIDIRQGLWPAFWTVGVAREWPGNGELDIMEYFRRTLLANAAWGSERRGTGVWDDSKTPIDQVARAAGYASAEAWAAEFHVWRMDWDESWIRFYVDGRLLNEVDLSRTINREPGWDGGVGGGINPFHEPQHIILNLAVGATGGDPTPTEFPARYEVDWVRVYQPSSPGDPGAGDGASAGAPR